MALLPHQIKQIERALADVGEYGEVRLIVAKGKLRLPMPYSATRSRWAARRIQRVISEEVLTPAETQEPQDARAARRG